MSRKRVVVALAALSALVIACDSGNGSTSTHNTSTKNHNSTVSGQAGGLAVTLTQRPCGGYTVTIKNVYNKDANYWELVVNGETQNTGALGPQGSVTKDIGNTPTHNGELTITRIRVIARTSTGAKKASALTTREFQDRAC